MNIGKELRPYQKVGANFMFSRSSSLLADEMGLGKTIQAIELINLLHPGRVLIVCPASVRQNWKEELRSWLNTPYSIEVIQSGNDKIYPNTQIHIVSYNLLLNKNVFKQIEAIARGLIICDEAHFLKNIKSKRTKAVLSRKGVGHLFAKHVFLTGTPVLNRPAELYPLLKTISRDPEIRAMSYHTFAERYNGLYQDGWGVFKLGNATNIEDLKRKLAPIMLRRTIEEVGEQLPKVNMNLITLEQTPDIEKIIRLEDEMYVSGSATQEEAYGNMATLRRLTALAKLPQCVSFIKDTLETEGKVVVFAHHREVIDRLRQQLSGYGIALLWGAMSDTVKSENINKFINQKEIRIFIGQIDAAGQGINGLQKVCNKIIFVEPAWTPGQIAQAIGRLRRIGQFAAHIFAYMLLAKGTIEEAMVKSMVYKDEIIQKLMNGGE